MSRAESIPGGRGLAATLIVLAAGLGTRFGGTKQLEPVGPNGEPLLEYSMFDAWSVGFHRMLFVIQRDDESWFRSWLDDRIGRHCHVDLVYQELTDLPATALLPPERRKPWGTGHAVRSCRAHLSGSFAVVNADDFYGRASYAQVAQFLRQHSRADREMALVGFQLRQTLSESGPVSRGICRIDGQGYLLGIDERRNVGLHEDGSVIWAEGESVHRLPASAMASMNMWVFPAGFMDDLDAAFSAFLRAPERDLAQDEFFLPAVVDDLVVRTGARVHVLPTPARWMGMTYRQDADRIREGLRRLVEQGEYPRLLWGNRA